MAEASRNSAAISATAATFSAAGARSAIRASFPASSVGVPFTPEARPGGAGPRRQPGQREKPRAQAHGARDAVPDPGARTHRCLVLLRRPSGEGPSPSSAPSLAGAVPGGDQRSRVELGDDAGGTPPRRTPTGLSLTTIRDGPGAPPQPGGPGPGRGRRP